MWGQVDVFVQRMLRMVAHGPCIATTKEWQIVGNVLITFGTPFSPSSINFLAHMWAQFPSLISKLFISYLFSFVAVLLGM